MHTYKNNKSTERKRDGVWMMAKKYELIQSDCSNASLATFDSVVEEKNEQNKK